MFVCTQCKEKKDEIAHCCSCGGIFTIIELPPHLWNEGKKHRSSLTPKEILKKNVKIKTISGFEFLGEVPRKFSMLIYGKPGEGKSTFSLRFANALAKKKKTLYVSGEESLDSGSLRKKIVDEKIDADLLVICAEKKLHKVFKAIEREKPEHLFIDSITSLRLGIENICQLRDSVKGLSAFIAQSIKSEKGWAFRGSQELPHEVDAVFFAEEGELVTQKNRFVTIPLSYTIFDKKAANLQQVLS